MPDSTTTGLPGRLFLGWRRHFRLSMAIPGWQAFSSHSLTSTTIQWCSLRYLCICKMDVTQECVQRIKSSKVNLELCCDTGSWVCKICEPFQPEIPDPKIKATHKVHENLTFKNWPGRKSAKYYQCAHTPLTPAVCLSWGGATTKETHSSKFTVSKLARYKINFIR